MDQVGGHRLVKIRLVQVREMWTETPHGGKKKASVPDRDGIRFCAENPAGY